MEKISLMLVDDHDVVRSGLKTLLEGYPDLLVVAEANDGTEAVSQALEVHPDVILMDITMPGMDGLEATRRLKSVSQESRILALTVHEDKQYFFEMLGAGASGYITKRAAAEELVSAIRAVATGHVYLQPALARWLLEDYMRLVTGTPQAMQDPSAPPLDGDGLEVLSERERQVLELVAEGLTSNQIGEQLGISPKTVARHRERIMNKLNMHSCPELVKFAIRTGLIALN
jgi:two-component system response regulator NreC